ncbi:mucin-4 [Zeugodacus cucurbitae]|uniref:mucin-4 n=1 Tax=Zeugodacus cucurbitae TaxID=28588 RepID=UPI0023D95CF8|nr:mucin-4 [Zeugodacus cucurbitae]XP_028893631.2 mucin-4 [Zeugodacus cucurbitae]XP_028893633.2 mucin-4 [Zeugodacus cucurbitae]
MSNAMSDSEMSASGGALEDSDTNSSSSSSMSSSTSSSDVNDSLLDTLELAKITHEVIRLPRGLCENRKIFQEFFSVETWNNIPELIRASVERHLPDFTNILSPEETSLEIRRTLSMLFNEELMRFGHSPLCDLQQELEGGNFRPDVLRLRQNISKSRRREQRFQRCERVSQLAKELFLSRERLLRTAYKSSPNSILRTERNTKREQNTFHADTKLCSVRCRKRVRKELDHITDQLGIKTNDLSADEEDGSSVETITDDSYCNLKSEIPSVLKLPASGSDRLIFSTLFKRRKNLSDEDVIRSDQNTKQYKLSNRNFRSYIREHKRRKITEPTLPDFETSDIRLRDVCARAQLGGNFKQLFGASKLIGRKSKPKLVSYCDPPALVPITTNDTYAGTSGKKEIEIKLDNNSAETISKNLKEPQGEQFQQRLSEHSNGTMQHPFLPEDGAPFNILDGEVELQQEEVETYGSCEEGLPSFVISNEVVLPTIEPTEVPPHKLLQTPHKEDASSVDFQGKYPLAENIGASTSAEHNIPKLESIFSKMNKTPVKEKARSNLNCNATNILSSTGAVVTPIKRQNQPMTSPPKSNNPTILSESTELIQETHACFFSLIRDLFCATPHHRMQYNELRMRIDVWLRNPITALNDWYAQSDNWSALLTSAINFLAGDFSDQPDEYVPYLEFKSQQNIFQWIGAGRDSDTRLSKLCFYWLQRREISDRAPTAISQVITADAKESSNNIKINNTTHPSNEIDDTPVAFDGGVSPPPPPRCPTTWTVCAATPEEIVEFQRQERERFEQPHRAYTYRMHDYESVVGPVKGIYTQMYALTKARGHSMMIGNRPNFVTILTLVRDATARLPNGEGTRADIAELLKSSQYINLKEGENVLQTTVSGALDRMHTEHDPCVRYDPKRKIWIYLHRNRSEDDFERIHQQSQGVGKSKKVVHRKTKTKVAIGKPTSELNDSNSGLITCEDEPNGGAMSTASTNTKVSAAFSMPALVPANPIIVSSQSAITQQKIPLVITKPSVNRSLPVPPLKYNIPHQQQKSLLKTTVQSQSQRHQEHRQINNNGGIDTQVPQLQRMQQRMAILPKNTTVTDVVSEENQVNKQLTLSMSPIKSNLTTLTTGNVNSTPIIVATPSGLQTVHVSNATVVTSSTGASVSLASQQPSSLSATFSGKKVALNKPIIINQIKSQPTLSVTSQTRSTSQQVLKQQNIVYTQQQQKHTQGFIIPISMSNSISNVTDVEAPNIMTKETNLRSLPLSSISTDGSTTIYMDNTKLVSGVETLSPEQVQQNKSHGKNIIRIVPSISGGGVKSILQSASTGTVVTSRKPPVHVIGHRVVTGGGGIGTARVQTPQTKSLSNISLMSSSSGTQTFGVSSMVSAAGGSTLIKMSPHTFASLQHKQNQQIVVKKSSPLSPVSNPQHRVIDKSTLLKNSAVVPQSGSLNTQPIGKKVYMQQTSNLGIVHKTVVSGAASVGSQTSSTSSLAEKVHTINTTNLTSQQQRTLLQNIKQQQSIQLKSVHVVSSDSTTTCTQSQINQAVSRAQPLTVATSDVVVGHQANNKALAVMVSQAQGLPRILKAGSTNSQPLQQQQTMTIAASDNSVGTTASGTRILTTSTGQIISLESLLQKQSSNISVKTNLSGGVGAIVKNVHTSNISQQQQPQLVTSTGNTNTYTVVSQPRNVNAYRPATTQTTDGVNTGTKTTLVSGGTGRIFVSAGGQMTTPQITKVLGKAGVTTASLTNATAGGNIRVIKNTSNIGSVSNSFNVTSLQGKQVVFAAKPSTNIAKHVGSSAQVQQIPTGVVIGGQTLKLQRNVQQNKIVNSTSTNNGSNIGVTATHQGAQMQTVIMGNQILRVQQMQASGKTVGSNGPTVQQRIANLSVGNLVTGSAITGVSGVNNGNESGNNATTMNLPKTVVLGSSGQTIRLQQPQQSVPMTHQLQPSTQISTQSQTQLVSVKNSSQQGVKASNVGRVVLAVQGGGQIFLSPNFQGNTLNLKTLQNMKVVSLASHTGTAVNISNQSEDKSNAATQNCGSSNS